VFDQAWPIWRSALMKAGCDGRQGDVAATLLAGRDLLLFDGPPDQDSIDHMLDLLVPLISELSISEAEDSDGQQCLATLLGFVPNYWRSGARLTIGQMIALALAEPSLDGEYARALRVYGMRLQRTPSGIVLIVANRHEGLKRIYRDTQRWGDGAWPVSLGRLGEDVLAFKDSLWFAGVKSRGMAVPAHYLPAPQAGDQSPDTPNGTERTSRSSAVPASVPPEAFD
jgi:hypothetical protein